MVLCPYVTFAQSDNLTGLEDMPFDSSTDIGEQESRNAAIGVIYTIFVVIIIVISGIRLRSPKTNTRAKIALILLLVITVFVGIIAYSAFLILAIFLVIIALIIAFTVYRTKKPIPWKQHKGVRRYFPAQVRDQVLKDQKYRCTNCLISISAIGTF